MPEHRFWYGQLGIDMEFKKSLSISFGLCIEIELKKSLSIGFGLGIKMEF